MTGTTTIHQAENFDETTTCGISTSRVSSLPFASAVTCLRCLRSAEAASQRKADRIAAILRG